MGLNLYPIDPDEFAAFLCSQGMQATVGTSCDDTDCPLARFLNTQYEGSRFAVNVGEYRRLMDDISLGVEADEVYSLPEWASEFAELVDASDRFNDGVPISALAALCFLQAACAVYDVPLSAAHQAGKEG